MTTTRELTLTEAVQILVDLEAEDERLASEVAVPSEPAVRDRDRRLRPHGREVIAAAKRESA